MRRNIVSWYNKDVQGIRAFLFHPIQPSFCKRPHSLNKSAVKLQDGGFMVKIMRVPIKESVREYILERDAFMCAYCDGEADCVDHIIPYAYCQSHDVDNLVAACMDCNLIASDKIFESLSKKREYIRHKRGLHKWQTRIFNRYTLCIVCRLPFLEGHKYAKHFICPRCNKHGWEWKDEHKKPT